MSDVITDNIHGKSSIISYLDLILNKALALRAINVNRENTSQPARVSTIDAMQRSLALAVRRLGGRARRTASMGKDTPHATQVTQLRS